MLKKLFFLVSFIFCFFPLIHAQSVSKITGDFQKNYKSEKVDDRVSAVTALKGVEWKVTVTLLSIVFEENNMKVLAAAQEVLESYQAQPEVGKWILTKGIYSIKNKFGRSYMVSALGKYKYEDINEMMLKLLKVNKEQEFLVPLLECIGALGYPSSIPELINSRKNPLYMRHYGFRRSLFDALIQFPDKSVVEFFINTVDENEGLNAVQVGEYLALVTGSRQSGGAGWKKWWEENKATFEVKKVSLEEINTKILAVKPTGEVKDYYGISLLAKRIVFVLDVSGSMNFKKEGAKDADKKTAEETRLDVAKRELIYVISSLPDKTLIEIVDFSNLASLWFGELKALTNPMKQVIEKRINGIKAVGGTNTHDSIEKALALNDNVEAVYFLSDGAPSLGSIIDNDELLNQIYRWNRFKKVQIHSIGLLFGVPPPEFTRQGFREDTAKLKSFLTNLATQNGGQFKFVE